MRVSPTAQNYIRKRASELMADECRIFKPTRPVLDRTTGKTTTPSPTVKYEGVCRYWEVQSGQQISVGDEQLTLTQSYLSLPYDAPVPESDDIVEITKSVDPTLQGTTVAVISITRGGGLRGSRKLLVRVVESKKDSW
jgi:hypothetical protein